MLKVNQPLASSELDARVATILGRKRALPFSSDIAAADAIKAWLRRKRLDLKVSMASAYDEDANGQEVLVYSFDVDIMDDSIIFGYSVASSSADTESLALCLALIKLPQKYLPKAPTPPRQTPIQSGSCTGQPHSGTNP